jgi:molybdate transport system regulatory protein
MEVKSKVWLEENGRLVFGEGKSELLRAIDETGSISEAAKKMGISFRHAWGYITAIEKRLGMKFIIRSKGGRGGGGSYLTPSARALIDKYDKLRNLVTKFADVKFKELFTRGTRYIKNR